MEEGLGLVEDGVYLVLLSPPAGCLPPLRCVGLVAAERPHVTRRNLLLQRCGGSTIHRLRGLLSGSTAVGKIDPSCDSQVLLLSCISRSSTPVAQPSAICPFHARERRHKMCEHACHRCVRGACPRHGGAKKNVSPHGYKKPTLRSPAPRSAGNPHNNLHIQSRIKTLHQYTTRRLATADTDTTCHAPVQRKILLLLLRLLAVLSRLH